MAWPALILVTRAVLDNVKLHALPLAGNSSVVQIWEKESYGQDSLQIF